MGTSSVLAATCAPIHRLPLTVSLRPQCIARCVGGWLTMRITPCRAEGDPWGILITNGEFTSFVRAIARSVSFHLQWQYWLTQRSGLVMLWQVDPQFVPPDFAYPDSTEVIMSSTNSGSLKFVNCESMRRTSAAQCMCEMRSCC